MGGPIVVTFNSQTSLNHWIILEIVLSYFQLQIMKIIVSSPNVGVERQRNLGGQTKDSLAHYTHT